MLLLNGKSTFRLFFFFFFFNSLREPFFFSLAFACLHSLPSFSSPHSLSLSLFSVSSPPPFPSFALMDAEHSTGRTYTSFVCVHVCSSREIVLVHSLLLFVVLYRALYSYTQNEKRL